MLSAAASVQAFCEHRVCSSIWMPNRHLCCPGDCMPKHVLAHVTNASLGDLHILLMPFFFFSGGGVPKDILAHVTDMVDEGCRVCRRVQAEGIQVLSLITRDPHSLTELASAQEREKWAGAVKVRNMNVSMHACMHTFCQPFIGQSESVGRPASQPVCLSVCLSFSHHNFCPRVTGQIRIILRGFCAPGNRALPCSSCIGPCHTNF